MRMDYFVDICILLIIRLEITWATSGNQTDCDCIPLTDPSKWRGTEIYAVAITGSVIVLVTAAFTAVCMSLTGSRCTVNHTDHPPSMQFNKAGNSVQVITDQSNPGIRRQATEYENSDDQTYDDVVEQAQSDVANTKSKKKPTYTKVGYEYHEIQFLDRGDGEVKGADRVVQIPAEQSQSKETRQDDKPVVAVEGQAPQHAQQGWMENTVYVSSDDTHL
ncbi:uncharacterized protein [Amphiura filiformis]|uniref:uncharacterized protein isoform X2 n=1 Tax=Amphiura filiformis TaxID=82378 RepID=UPI003B21496F